MNGTIDHRPDRKENPWRGRYLAPNGRQPSKCFAQKWEAEEWLRDELGRIDRGSWRDPAGGKQRYADHAQGWIDGLVGLKEKTTFGYENLMRSRILPVFGKYPISQIQPRHVRSWIADMDAEGLSPSRIRQAHQVLRASLDQAVSDNTLGRNPAAGVRLPKSQPRDILKLNPNQIHRLAASASEHQPGAGTLVTFLAYAGLRWGEAVALRVNAVDPLRHRIHVTESATEVGGRLVFGKPKNHRNRVVVVPRSVMDQIAAHIAQFRSVDGLVFTSPNGHPLRSTNFRRSVWTPAVSELIDTDPHLAGLRIHDLRHTAASLAISCGANIKVIQRMLGHKDASMTLNVYGDLYTDDLEALADRLEERFRGAA
jgi:integrase